MKAEIYKRSDGKTWDYRILAANGEIIATSGGQGFSERGDCYEAIRRLVEVAMDPDFVISYAQTEAHRKAAGIPPEPPEQDVGGEG